MAYLGNAPARSFISFERQVFTIVNSQTAYTLDHSVNNENDIRLVVNNVVQEPGSGKAYTASGTTLTLSAALTNGTDEMYCVFLGRATATNAPGAGSVNTAAITDLNVTTAKIAADAVNGDKIADDAISDEHLDPTAITGQTAETTIADDDLILISDTSASAALKKMTKANFVSGVGGDNTPAFFAYQSSDQTGIADVTFTTIEFDAESFDTDSAYNTSNYTFTVPSGEGGKYVFGLRINAYFYSDKAWQFMQNLYINGSERIELGVIDEPSNDNSRYGGTCTEKVILTLAAGDTVLAQVYGNTRSNNSFKISGSGSARKNSYFYGYKLIGL